MLFSAAVSQSWLQCPGHSPSAPPPLASVPVSKGLPQLVRELHPSVPATLTHLPYLIFSPTACVTIKYALYGSYLVIYYCHLLLNHELPELAVSVCSVSLRFSVYLTLLQGKHRV